MMHLRQWLYFLLFSVAPGLTYQAIQDQWRAARTDSDFGAYLMGVAPNFLGAVSVASALFLIGMNRSPKTPRSRLMLIAAGISMLGLWVWEALQIFLPSASFDWHDIAWTAMGATLFMLVTRIWFREEQRFDDVTPAS
ncbi:hypothetical protein [Hyphococcus sp.]|jgi:hypothetical protein|uniref:hypothetical protein n=1 Tax=Hyphococcus sp. TaxID=2038636 RepID=UPI003D09D22F